MNKPKPGDVLRSWQFRRRGRVLVGVAVISGPSLKRHLRPTLGGRTYELPLRQVAF